MPTVRFTKRTIDALPHPEKGQVLCRGEMLRGSGLRVGAQSKVFHVEGQVHQRTKRVPERRRRGVVCAHDMPAWWAAVMEEPEYSRDFLLIALFTGMRRNEIAALRWEQINLRKRALHMAKTKNGDPLILPLSDFLVGLLRERQDQAGASPWVFPSTGRKGHIVETKKFTARVTERSGVSFTLHDLRRTFINIAESLDVPHYALKRLLNHRLSGDVTAGYINSDLERLRGPVSLVAAKILINTAGDPGYAARKES